MDKQVKKDWIEALRSGEYEQGHTQLANLDKKGEIENHCCLGVLCVVQGFDLIDHGPGPRYSNAVPELEYSAGLTDKQMTSLYDLNDNQGYSFEGIADYIEENIPGE